MVLGQNDVAYAKSCIITQIRVWLVSKIQNKSQNIQLC